MKPKCIGIIGGAGPLAGTVLLERIFLRCREEYGCYRDADFPQVLLISYPFSEMLTEDLDANQIRRELNGCLGMLRNNGAAVLSIACNTLHAFLDKGNEQRDLVQLSQVVAETIIKLSASDMPVVFCTSTAAKYELHKQFFPCTYPDRQTQWVIDSVINGILKGDESSAVLEKLQSLIQEFSERVIILGCTELSIFSNQLTSSNLIIDPLNLMVNRILEKSFMEGED